jgi:RNA polymerase sigma-70 factor, ECF subfamily
MSVRKTVGRAELAAAFGTNASSPAELANLETFWVTATQAWPDIDVDAEDFMRRLRELKVNQPDPLRAADLLLAFACARGDPTAIGHFESTVVARLEPMLARIDSRPDVIDEARQQVRERLLVRTERSPPRLAEYRGEAPLWSWVKTVAVRLLVDQARTRRSDELADAPLLEQQLEQSGALDLSVIRMTHRPQVLRAFARALAAMGSTERTLLRLAFVEGLSVDQIAAVYQKSRATAARWVAAARTALGEHTRALLTAELGLEGDELMSLLRELDVSLERSLRHYLGPDSQAP